MKWMEFCEYSDVAQNVTVMFSYVVTRIYFAYFNIHFAYYLIFRIIDIESESIFRL
jgi:hypothetical protein